MQSDPSGRPQHLALQMKDGTLYASSDIGAETVSAAIRLTTVNTFYDASIWLSTSVQRLELLLDPSTCNGEPHCLSTATPLKQDEDAVSFQGGGPAYVGRVPQLNAYIRSRLKTLEGFRGCLGVSNEHLSLNEKMHIIMKQCKRPVRPWAKVPLRDLHCECSYQRNKSIFNPGLDTHTSHPHPQAYTHISHHHAHN